MTVWVPTAAAIAEIVFFPLATAIVVVRLRRSALETQQKWLLAGAMVFSVLAKVALARIGHNYDVESYRLVGNILARGGSVYANTGRYNYGPIWAWLVAGFGCLAGTGGGEHFHVWIAAFLAIVDVLICMAIASAYSWIGAMVFVLSPIGLLISGFDSQFDNLAVLIGLYAWLQVRAGKPKPTTLIASSICLGISLIVKHILFLFPIWLVFWKPLGRLRCRILYAAIAYGLFAGAFLPWWNDPPSRAGIVQNVFRYSGQLGNSWVGYAIQVFMPMSSLTDLLASIHIIGGLKTLWTGLMVAAGVPLASSGKRELYLYYLMLLCASSPTYVVHYIAIPMLAAAVFFSSWESWAFVAAGTLAILTCEDSGFLFAYHKLSLFTYRGLPPLVIDGLRSNLAQLLVWVSTFCLAASQFCIAALIWKQWRERSEPLVTRSLPAKIRSAAALVAIGGLPVFMVVTKSAVAHWKMR
jgi:hypothetical protein